MIMRCQASSTLELNQSELPVFTSIQVLMHDFKAAPDELRFDSQPTLPPPSNPTGCPCHAPSAWFRVSVRCLGMRGPRLPSDPDSRQSLRLNVLWRPVFTQLRSFLHRRRHCRPLNWSRTIHLWPNYVMLQMRVPSIHPSSHCILEFQLPHQVRR